jgi:hypothetical protein
LACSFIRLEGRNERRSRGHCMSLKPKKQKSSRDGSFLSNASFANYAALVSGG